MLLVLLSTWLFSFTKILLQSYRSRSHIYFCHLDIYWLNVWMWANQRRDTKIGKQCKDIAFVINITISTKRTTSQLACSPKTWSSWTQWVWLTWADLWNFYTFLAVFLLEQPGKLNPGRVAGGRELCWRLGWIPGESRRLRETWQVCVEIILDDGSWPEFRTPDAQILGDRAHMMGLYTPRSGSK